MKKKYNRPEPNFKLLNSMAKNRISTLELGYASGVSGGMISMIRQGWKRPSEKLAMRIEATLEETGLFK